MLDEAMSFFLNQLKEQDPKKYEMAHNRLMQLELIQSRVSIHRLTHLRIDTMFWKVAIFQHDTNFLPYVLFQRGPREIILVSSDDLSASENTQSWTFALIEIQEKHPSSEGVIVLLSWDDSLSSLFLSVADIVQNPKFKELGLDVSSQKAIPLHEILLDKLGDPKWEGGELGVLPQSKDTLSCEEVLNKVIAQIQPTRSERLKSGLELLSRNDIDELVKILSEFLKDSNVEQLTAKLELLA